MHFWCVVDFNEKIEITLENIYTITTANKIKSN